MLRGATAKEQTVSDPLCELTSRPWGETGARQHSHQASPHFCRPHIPVVCSKATALHENTVQDKQAGTHIRTMHMQAQPARCSCSTNAPSLHGFRDGWMTDGKRSCTILYIALDPQRQPARCDGACRRDIRTCTVTASHRSKLSQHPAAASSSWALAKGYSVPRHTWPRSGVTKDATASKAPAIAGSFSLIFWGVG